MKSTNTVLYCVIREIGNADDIIEVLISDDFNKATEEAKRNVNHHNKTEKTKRELISINRLTK